MTNGVFRIEPKRDKDQMHCFQALVMKGCRMCFTGGEDS